jgi:N-acetyl-alpha-D-glucosaminyl L-malate synthase BshA
MKIVILVALFPPKWLAGTEIAAYNIAKYLVRKGHEVHVVTTLDVGLPNESIVEGFFVHRIFWRKIRFLDVISFWMKMLLTLRKIDPDVVHVQSIGIGIPGLLAKKILKKPYIVWGQGSDIYLPDKFTKSLSKLVLKNADAVIALTEDMKRKMQKIYDRNVFVIPNGIDLERFNNLPKETLRKRWKIKDEDEIITFVGTLRPIKGVEYLIRAMKIVRQKSTGARLMLVGDGEEREKLEKLVKELILEEYVRFIGKVQNEKVPEYMVASDIFILPSLSEGFPVTVLEAMASGLPIIVTRVRGLQEIIKDGENGFLVEPKNPEQIAEKVLMLLEDDELRERISRNNKKRVKDYSWESVVARLEGVYQRYL